jgi:hypothetical protein
VQLKWSLIQSLLVGSKTRAKHTEDYPGDSSKTTHSHTKMQNHSLLLQLCAAQVELNSVTSGGQADGGIE